MTASPPAGPHPAIDGLLEGMIAADEFPGAVYVVGTAGGPVHVGAVGRMAVEPADEPMPPDAVFDLASLTKPLATAAVALRLCGRGRLRLDQPVRELLRGWGRTDRADLTLRDLLLHRSGLPAWEPLYRHCAGPEEVLEYLGRRPLAHPPRERSVYSCLGYVVLGRCLEQAGGAGLDDLFAREVARPLGLDRTRFRPPASWRPHVVPTEQGNRRERELAGEEGTGDRGWPSGILRGEVHDRNARFLGGASGNAGLFGSAAEVERLGRAFLAPGLLDETALAAAATPEPASAGEARTVGFQSARTPDSAAGETLGQEAFGHTGFTGTSIFLDPLRKRSYVLLTNRVHPHWRAGPMNRLRRAFHRVAAGVLEARGL